MKKKPVPNLSPEEARCRRLLGEALGFLLPGTKAQQGAESQIGRAHV